MCYFFPPLPSQEIKQNLLDCSVGFFPIVKGLVPPPGKSSTPTGPPRRKKKNPSFHHGVILSFLPGLSKANRQSGRQAGEPHPCLHNYLPTKFFLEQFPQYRVLKRTQSLDCKFSLCGKKKKLKLKMQGAKILELFF